MAAPPPIKELDPRVVLKPDGTVDGRRLVKALNDFMRPVYAALRGGLTFEENFQGGVKEFTLRTRSPVEDTFPLQVQVPRPLAHPRGLLFYVCDAESEANAIITGAAAQILPAAQGRVTIQYISGLEPNHAYRVAFLYF